MTDPRSTGLPADDSQAEHEAEGFFYSTASIPTLAERLTSLAERFEEYARKTDELAKQLERHARIPTKD